MRVICPWCGQSVLVNMRGAINFVPDNARLRKHLQPGKWHSGVHDHYCEGSGTTDFNRATAHEWSQRHEAEAEWATGQGSIWHNNGNKEMVEVGSENLAFDQAQRLRDRADRIEMKALEELALRERFGEDSDYPHLCTLIFDINWPSWPNYSFTYVALKIIVPSTQEHRWYLTGSIAGNHVLNFDRLVSEFLTKANTVAYATEWTEL